MEICPYANSFYVSVRYTCQVCAALDVSNELVYRIDVGHLYICRIVIAVFDSVKC